jgi:cell division protein FtsQ
MAGDYYPNNTFTKRPNSQEEKTGNIEQLVRRFLIITAIVLLSVEAIWLLIINPCLPFSKIEISGPPGMEKDSVLHCAGIDTQSSYMTLDTTQAAIALRKQYHFSSIRVDKRFPGTLIIDIESLKPVALTFVQLDGKTTPVYFDRNGVTVQIGKNVPSTLPIISGEGFNQPRLGEYLIPPELGTFLPNLEQLRKSYPDMLTAVSEIRIDSRSYGYDLVIYPVTYPVRVRVGENLDKDKLKYVLLLIDVVASSGAKIDEIDFRSGTASYISKGASSG